MEKIAKLLLTAFTCFALQGCSGQMNKQGGGTLVGGVAGGSLVLNLAEEKANLLLLALVRLLEL